MFRYPIYTGRRPSTTTTFLTSLSSNTGWLSSHNVNSDTNDNRSYISTKNKSNNYSATKMKAKRRKDTESSLKGIVKELRKDVSFLPPALKAIDSYAYGSKNCDKCNMKKKEYKKYLEDIKIIDLLVDELIEKEQADLMENSSSEDEAEKEKNEANTINNEHLNKGTKFSLEFEIFCPKKGIDHNLQCILINLQNTIGRVLVQVCYVKSNSLGNDDRFKKFNISIDDLRLLKFEYSYLTSKIIMLLKRPSIKGLSRPDICVECVKEKLFVHNASLSELLRSGRNLKLAMKNSESGQRPGLCCQRSYPHLHAEALGRPIVLKYYLPFKAGKPVKKLNTPFDGGGDDSELDEPQHDYETQPFEIGKTLQKSTNKSMLDDTHYNGVDGADEEREQNETPHIYEGQPFKNGKPYEEFTEKSMTDVTHFEDGGDVNESEQDGPEHKHEPQFDPSVETAQLHPSENNGRYSTQSNFDEEDKSTDTTTSVVFIPSNQTAEVRNPSLFTHYDKKEYMKSPKSVTFRSIESLSSEKHGISSETPPSVANYDLDQGQQNSSNKPAQSTKIEESNFENKFKDSAYLFPSEHTPKISEINSNESDGDFDFPTKVNKSDNLHKINELEIRSVLTINDTLPVQSRHSKTSIIDKQNVFYKGQVGRRTSLSGIEIIEDDKKEFDKVNICYSIKEGYEQLSAETLRHKSDIEHFQKNDTASFDDGAGKESDVLAMAIGESKVPTDMNWEHNYSARTRDNKQFNQSIKTPMVETQNTEQNDAYKDPVVTSHQKRKRVSFSDPQESYEISNNCFETITKHTYDDDISEHENEPLLNKQLFKEITHPNKKVEEVLRTLDKESLLRMSSPAECNRGCYLPFLAKNRDEPNIPLSPSLYSLPLDEDDLLYIVTEVGKSLEVNREKDIPVVKFEWEEEARDRGNVNNTPHVTKWERALAATETPPSRNSWKDNSTQITSKRTNYYKGQYDPKGLPTITEECFVNETKIEDDVASINQELKESILENNKCKGTQTELWFCTVQVDKKCTNNSPCGKFEPSYLKQFKSVFGTEYYKNSVHPPNGPRKDSLVTSSSIKGGLKEKNYSNHSQFQRGKINYHQNCDVSALSSRIRDSLSLALEEMAMLSAIYLPDAGLSNPVPNSKLRSSTTTMRGCKDGEAIC